MIGVSALLLMTIESCEVWPTWTDAGENDPVVPGATMLIVAVAGAAAGAFVGVTVTLLVAVPATFELTVAVTVQLPPAGIAAPVSVRFEVPPATPEGQFVVGGVKFAIPAGYVSVKVAMIGIVFGFVMLTVSVAIPFTPAVATEKDFVTVGAVVVTVVSVADAVLVPALDDTVAVFVTELPLMTTGTLIVQLAPGDRLVPENERPLLVVVTIAEPHDWVVPPESVVSPVG